MQKEAKKFNVSQFGIKPFGSRINLSKKRRDFLFLRVQLLQWKHCPNNPSFAGSQIFHVCGRKPYLHFRKTTCMNTCRAANLALCGCYYQWTKVAAARSWYSTFWTHQRGIQSKQVECWHSSVVVQIPTATSTVCLGQWLVSCTEQQRLLQRWNYHLQSKNLLSLPSVFNTVRHQRQWSIWHSLIKTTRSPAVMSDKCQLSETPFAQPNHKVK